MATDMIDELLRADEEELKAKRNRLRTFARAVETVRESVRQAQETGEAIAASDGLSRADITKTFGLSSAEKALLLPSRRGRSANSSGAPGGTEEPGQSDAAPNDALHQQ